MTSTENTDRSSPSATPAKPSTAAGLGSIAGLLALGAGLGAASFVAAVAKVDGPIVAVANRFVDQTPRWLKEFAVRNFGTSDKTVLTIGITVVLLVAAAGAGRLARRRLPVALAAVGVVGALGVGAAVTRTGSRGADWLPPMVGTLVAAGALAWMARPSRSRGARATAAPVAESPLVFERRRFIVQASAVGIGAAALGGVGRAVRSNRDKVLVRTAQAQTLPTPRSPAQAVPDTASVGRGVGSYLTPNADFYRIDTSFSPPTIDPATWKMTIDGMVEHPITITYDELLARPMIERIVTLTCVSNEVGGDLIGNARWLGVPLADLLHEAKVKPGATQIASRSVDGWTCGFPTAIALDGRDALVAVAMNGEPLPRAHGFPARLVVPGLYGYVSATKWLDKITLTTLEDFDGYWIPRGWSKDGPIKTQSRIEVPRLAADLPIGHNVVAGVAWAPHRGIGKVEVQMDDGPWMTATLADQPTVDGWRQWWLDWDAPAGRHILQVRATDATGAVQTADKADVAPNGATGYHGVGVNVK